MEYFGMLLRAHDPGQKGPHALGQGKSSQLLLSISCSSHKLPNPIIKNCTDPKRRKIHFTNSTEQKMLLWWGVAAFCKLLVLPLF